jgi:hypothetical protein
LSSQLLVNKFILCKLKQYRNSPNLLVISYQYILNPPVSIFDDLFIPGSTSILFPYLAKKLEVRYLLLLLRKLRLIIIFFNHRP